MQYDHVRLVDDPAENMIFMIMFSFYDPYDHIFIDPPVSKQLVFLSGCAAVGNVSAARSNNSYLSSLTPPLKMLFDIHQHHHHCDHHHHRYRNNGKLDFL